MAAPALNTLTLIKLLEARATPAPWRHVLDPVSIHDAHFVNALRNLAPELLDLWEAANDLRDLQTSLTWTASRAGEVQSNHARALHNLNEAAAALGVK